MSSRSLISSAKTKSALFLLLAFLSAAGAASAAEKYGNTTVWAGDNGRSEPKQKSGNTTYWVQRSAAGDVANKLEGLIYQRQTVPGGTASNDAKTTKEKS